MNLTAADIYNILGGNLKDVVSHWITVAGIIYIVTRMVVSE